jgi:hypothetical protein
MRANIFLISIDEDNAMSFYPTRSRRYGTASTNFNMTIPTTITSGIPHNIAESSVAASEVSTDIDENIALLAPDSSPSPVRHGMY